MRPKPAEWTQNGLVWARMAAGMSRSTPLLLWSRARFGPRETGRGKNFVLILLGFRWVQKGSSRETHMKVYRHTYYQVFESKTR
jgi:hypothetical protein